MKHPIYCLRPTSFYFFFEKRKYDLVFKIWKRKMSSQNNSHLLMKEYNLEFIEKGHEESGLEVGGRERNLNREKRKLLRDNYFSRIIIWHFANKILKFGKKLTVKFLFKFRNSNKSGRLITRNILNGLWRQKPQT